MLAVPGYSQLDLIVANSETESLYRAINEQGESVYLRQTAQQSASNPHFSIENQLPALSIVGIHKTFYAASFRFDELIVPSSACSFEVVCKKTSFWPDKIKLMIALVRFAKQFYDQQFILANVQPELLIFNTSTYDFQLLSHFNVIKTSAINNNQILDQTKLTWLATAAPESTGRLSVAMDERTTFYSLGCLFYYIILEQYPFQAQDIGQLIHQHIAVDAIFIKHLDKSTPVFLSKLIEKLLNKNQEDRYQTFHGLLVDLDILLNDGFEYSQSSQTDIALNDVSKVLRFTNKLYGRHYETQQLMSELTHSTNQGRMNLLVVKGYSGIGKTAVIDSIMNNARNRGRFCGQGKFEQYQRKRAYHALLVALEQVANMLLQQSEAELKQWQVRFSVFSMDEQVLLAKHMPAFSLLFKEMHQTDVQSSNSEEQNDIAFSTLLIRLYRVLSSNEHALLIFIDDMQWADLATLNLIQKLMEDRRAYNVLFIIAYRTNAVETIHPLAVMLNELEQQQACVTSLDVLALSHAAVRSLLSDLLNQTHDDVEALASLVLEKTGGNPFFIRQFLRELETKKLLSLSNANTWQWQVAEIQQENITDNLIELTAIRLARTSLQAQHVAKMIACVGDEIEFVLLTSLLPLMEMGCIALTIDELVNSNIINVKVNNEGNSFESLSFVHDRVQQAAYDNVLSQSTADFHLVIAHYYLQCHEHDGNTHSVFNLATHANLASELFIEQNSREKFIQQNVLAAEHALDINAYAVALNFIDAALKVTVPDDWQLLPTLIYRLQLARLRNLYFAHHYDEIETIAAEVLEYEIDLLNMIAVNQVRITAFTAQNQMQEAYDLGCQMIAQVGVDLINPKHAFEQYLTLNELYDQRDISGLANKPNITDKFLLAAIDILALIQTSAYLIGAEYFVSVIFTATKIAMEHGNSTKSGKAYAAHALLLCGGFNQFEQGAEFSQLAKCIAEKTHDQQHTAEVHFIHLASVSHWHDPLQNTIEPLLNNFHLGIESSSVEYGFHSLLFYGLHQFLAGTPLNKVNDDFLTHIRVMQDKNQQYHVGYSGIWHQLSSNLACGNKDALEFKGETFNEHEHLDAIRTTNNLTTLFCFHVGKLMNAYLLDDIDLALQHVEQGDQYSNIAVSLYHLTEYQFFAALTELKAAGKALDKTQQQMYIDGVNHRLAMISLWAIHSPRNHLHKETLIKAELARLAGKKDAWCLYDEAREQAKISQILHHCIIVEELTGRYWLHYDKQDHALTHLLKAYKYSEQWQSLSVSSRLQHSYPTLLTAKKIDAGKGISTSVQVDIASIFKASEALSGDVDINAFLMHMMQIMVENAGAQTGCLMVKSDNKLDVKACNADKYNDNYVPSALLAVALRTNQPQVVNNEQELAHWNLPNWFLSQGVKSFLCLPISVSGEVKGVLYFEHQLISGVFNDERIDVLQLLGRQTAIQIENAQLYQQLIEYNKNLEAKVESRTAELAIAKDVAEEATAAKSNFLAKMSHEIRTPMNAVIGLSRLTMRTELSNQQQDYLNKILASSEALLVLINDILDFSKVEVGKMSMEKIDFDLHHVVKKAVEICHLRVYEKGLELITYIDPNTPAMLVGDPLRIQQILVNLLTNATKFTEQGHIALRFAAEVEGEHVVLHGQVSDTGVGIAPTQQTALFNSFEQGDDSITRQYGGSGLGLAICKQLCELMGGDISLESIDGQGATFNFKLHVALSEQQSEKHIKVTKDTLSKLRVLVVDDVSLSRQVIIDSISPYIMHIDTAADGVEALDKVKHAQEHNKGYDLVIMDWQMPDLDGIEAVKLMRLALLSSTPEVLMVSAYDREKIQHLAHDAGIEHFIEKPVDQSTLIDFLVGIVAETEYVTSGTEQFNEQVPDLSGKSILLVEDNSTNQQVALGFLSDTKGLVDVAENGEQALNMMRVKQYDLTLMDIQMPVMDGLTAVSKARQELHISTPIIAMTAHAQESDRQKSIDAGMNAHITKPIEPEVLYRTLAEYLNVSTFISLAPTDIELKTHVMVEHQQNTVLLVDRPTAIRRMQGRSELYDQLLSDFYMNNQQTSQLLYDLHQSGQKDVLFRHAHSLKSSAQYIGAYELSTAAALLEQNVKDTDANVNNQLSITRSLLDSVIAEIKPLFKLEVEVDFGVTRSLDRDAALNKLVELASLSQTASADAEDAAKQLLVLCQFTDVGPQAKEIFDLISEYEFIDAQQKIKSLQMYITE